jgi:hypothetical protein
MVKKVAIKRTPVKKPVAKKPVTKKPVTKKPVAKTARERAAALGRLTRLMNMVAENKYALGAAGVGGAGALYGAHRARQHFLPNFTPGQWMHGKAKQGMTKVGQKAAQSIRAVKTKMGLKNKAAMLSNERIRKLLIGEGPEGAAKAEKILDDGRYWRDYYFDKDMPGYTPGVDGRAAYDAYLAAMRGNKEVVVPGWMLKA